MLSKSPGIGSSVHGGRSLLLIRSALKVSGTLEEQDVKSWVVSLGMRLSVYHTRALSALSDCFPETVGCVAPKVEQVLAY